MLKSLTNKAKSALSGIFNGLSTLKKPEARPITSKKRKTDFTLVVCQRNDVKKLEIEAVDSEFEKVTGYTREYLTRRTLNEILPPKINETLNDYLEFLSDGNDLANVLSKVREFSLINKSGNIIPVNLRIMHTTTSDKNPRFYLIMKDIGFLKAINATREQMMKDLKSHQIIDEITGLPTKETFIKDLELIGFFVGKGYIKASLVVISIDRFDKLDSNFGRAVGNRIIKDIGSICKINFRDDDIVGYLGGNRIGAILFEADAETTKIPLNRLRWSINSKPLNYEEAKKPISVSVSISYSEVKRNMKISDILVVCEKEVETASSTLINAESKVPVIEVT